MRSRLLRIQLVFATCLIAAVLLVARTGTKLDRLPVLKTTVNTFLRASSPPFKHVTKSLAELGRMDELNGHVLMLNRVPKSGAEILVLLLQWMQGWNNFRHVRLKGNRKVLNNLQQEEFVSSFYETIRNEAVPMCLDRDVYFVNFTRFDRQSPTYVNLIRDPADYLISRFHNLMKLNVKSYNLKTPGKIEDCVLQRRPKCELRTGESYDLAIPYFCGQDPRCTLLNDGWALNRAKSNVERYYAVVGVLEEVNATLEVLESRLPFFFKGVQNLYYRDLLQPFHRNRKHVKASAKFRQMMELVLSKEYDFYEWIRRRLFGQLQIIYGENHH